MKGRNLADEASNILAQTIAGVRLFSRLWVPYFDHRPPSLEKMAPALPLSGLVIGVLPAGLLVAADASGLSPLVSSFIAIGAWALTTGAMQEDALADSFDGLWGGHTRERRLEIFKDSRIGAYGVLAMVVGVGVRAGALAQLLSLGGWTAAGLWLAATLLARSFALWLSVALPPARPTGAGAAAGRLSRKSFALGALGALVFAGILSIPAMSWSAFVLSILVLGVSEAIWSAICANRVGGQTGDLIGGGQAILEIVALCSFIVLGGL